MARFKSTTFGKISGKHGTAVAAVRKDGTNILKVLRVASNPNTPAQKNQRDKFAFTMRELNCFRSIYTLTYASQYGVNKAVGIATKTILSGEFPDFRLDYSNLTLSNGTLRNPLSIGIEQITGTSLTVKWTTEIFSNSSPNDAVNLVFLNQVSKNVILKQHYALRSDGSIEIKLPVIWAGKEIHCWIYFTTPEGSIFSTSQYICQLQL